MELLDRIAERVPELDVDAQPSIEWLQLPDGTKALAVNGGAVDGGSGGLFCNHGDDLHAYGSIMPIAPVIGCIVMTPDGRATWRAPAPTPWLRPGRCEVLACAGTSSCEVRVRRDQWERLQAAGYEGWRVAVAPFPSPPCRCERPVWWRDEDGTRCVNCGRRHRVKGEREVSASLPVILAGSARRQVF